MTIAKKLNIAVAAIVLGFLSSAAVLIVSNISASRLNELNLTVSRVVASMHRLGDAPKTLVITRVPLSDAIVGFDAAYGAMNETFDAAMNHPSLTLLSVDDSIAHAVRRWEVISNEFATARNLVLGIIGTELPAGITSAGIMRIRLSMAEQGVQDARFSLSLAAVETRVQGATAMGSQFLAEYLETLMTEIARRSSEIARRNLAASIALAAIVILGSLAFLILFGRSLKKKMADVATVMESIARRDITVRANQDARDEFGKVGRHVNDVLASLREFLSAVRGTIETVEELKDVISSGSTESAAALNEISSNIGSIRERFHTLNSHVESSADSIAGIAQEIEKLNENIQEQSGAIVQSSASIEQMTASVRSVTELASVRRERAEQLGGVVKDGEERIEATNDIIVSVSKEIDGILEITTIINEISERTNLLSMNAAIESAHAGEAGKGFAVVAEEIRKLADSTSDNAHQIDAALGSITGKIRTALDASEAGRKSFDRIVVDVADFSDSMNEISRAMDELSSGSREILDATGSISRITENVRGSSAQMTDRAQEIMSAMKGVQSISSELTNGIDEIDTGARSVLDSVVEISDKTHLNRERMGELGALIGTFTL